MTHPPVDPLAIVDQIIDGKYRIERLVAEGGFSFVYRAAHTGWKQPCVLKFLKGLERVEPRRRQQLEQALVQEGAILRELSSRTASILQAHDFGTWVSPDGGGYPYLVLEWLEGRPLSEVITEEKDKGSPPLSLHEAIALIDPVAKALSAAHKKGIAHRDLKPENIFVCGALRSDDVFLKVLDFGVAKILLDAGAQPRSPSAVSSQVAFTPFYGAPEQFNSNIGATGPWTDVFALALVLVELLSFERGLEGDDMLSLAVESVDTSRRPTPKSRGASVSDAVEAVFFRALSVDIKQRHQSLTEFWTDLQRAAGMEISDLSVAPPLSTRTPPAPLERPSSAGDASTLPSPSTAGPLVAASTAASPPGVPRMLVGVILGSVLVLVAGGAMLLGMHMKPARPAPAASASAVASAPAAVPLASAAPARPCPEGMSHIKGGDFYMGYDGEGAMPFEQPPHPVKLDAFCIDVTEVTVESYRACSEAGSCQRARTSVEWPGASPLHKKIYSPLCNIDDPGRDKHPINCVTWDMADNYCQRQGKRLPTSAEWEFAVRGPDGRTYPWGDEPPDANRLNACGQECLEWGRKNGVAADLFAMYKEDDGFPTTAPVGSFPKGRSRYGLDDVIGNVMEWVQDWDGPYDKAPKTNPRGPESGTERVIRGGAWNAGHMFWVRPSFRFHFPPGTVSHGVGFRCAAGARGPLRAPPEGVG